MGMRDLGLLFALGAIWGASFLFIKVAVSEVTPLTLSTVRLTLGTLGLLAYLWLRPAALPLSDKGKLFRSIWGHAIIIGLVAAVIPYLLIAWSQQYISSGAGAILNGTSPLFSALLAAMLPRRWGGDRLSISGFLGIFVGFAGVGVLVLGSGRQMTSQVAADLQVWGALAVMAGSLSYAVGGLYTHHHFAGAPPLVPAIAQNGMGALLLLGPAAVFAQPMGLPSPAVLGSLLALGLIGTSLAYLIYYDLLVRVGGTRTLLVTYLLPGTALIYGALLLGERIELNALGGMALVLLGIALTTGTGWQTLRWLHSRLRPAATTG